MSLEKICVSGTCQHKSRCYLWRRMPADQFQQYISPEATGDACHFYAEKPQAWGEGRDSDDND